MALIAFVNCGQLQTASEKQHFSRIRSK